MRQIQHGLNLGISVSPLQYLCSCTSSASGAPACASLLIALRSRGCALVTYTLLSPLNPVQGENVQLRPARLAKVSLTGACLLTLLSLCLHTQLCTVWTSFSDSSIAYTQCSGEKVLATRGERWGDGLDSRGRRHLPRLGLTSNSSSAQMRRTVYELNEKVPPL